MASKLPRKIIINELSFHRVPDYMYLCAKRSKVYCMVATLTCFFGTLQKFMINLSNKKTVSDELD